MIQVLNLPGIQTWYFPVIQTRNFPRIPISCAVFSSHRIPIPPDALADPKTGVRVWAAAGFSCGDNVRSWHLILLERWENWEGGRGKNGKRVRILMRGIWQLSWGGSLDGKALTAKARQEEQLLTDPAKTPRFLKKSEIPYEIFLRKSGIRVTGWTRVICLGVFLKPSFSLSNYKVLMVTLSNVVAQNSGIWTHSKEERIPWWELNPSIPFYPRHWMQLFHQAIPKYRPEHILPAHSRCWRQDKEHVGSVRMEIPKILTRFFHVFCSLCTDFPFFPEDELAKSPPSRKMPQTMLKNTGKGSNLSCPEPGTALKGSSNSFVLGKGIGKVSASHWLRF